jgi:hypothetical protein
MQRFLLLALFLLSGFLAWEITTSRHRDIPLQNDWRTFLWADQAGYFVYLPAHFIYDWDARKFPVELEAGTGYGFQLDTLHHKIRTKYPIGTALLQAPFFLIAHTYALIGTEQANGFSQPYIYAVQLAGITWGCIGLFSLFGFLRKRVKEGLALLVVGSIWLGSGLLYYHSDNVGMSHIYSFALFALLLNFLDQLDSFTYRKMMVLGLLVGMILLVRPTGALGIVSIILLLLPEKSRSWKQLFFSPKFLFMGGVSFLLICFPQLLYWKYSSGSFLNYSYGNESFSNWKNPELLKFWFSPNNGLFPNGPIWIGIMCTIFWGVWRGKYAARLGLGLFLFLSYLFSSWHIWFFGCGFGSRNFVEYTVLFAYPFAQGLESIWQKRGNWKRGLILLLLSLFCVVSLRLFQAYTKCFFGEGDWDWKEYSYLLLRNKQEFKVNHPVAIGANAEFTELFRFNQSDFTHSYFREMKAEWQLTKVSPTCENVQLVLKSEKGKDDPFYVQKNLCPERGNASEAYFGMWPQRSDSVIWVLYVWNPEKKILVLNELKAGFR